MLAVVLAAGRGTRLGALTTNRSKAMMPIVGHPMIARVLDMVAAGGADFFVIVVHPTQHELIEYLRRSSWGRRVELAYQHEREGMADAVEAAAPLVRERAETEFLLASCDNLFPDGHIGRLAASRRSDSLDAALSLMWAPETEANLGAVVEMSDGLVTDIIEKPKLTDVPSHGPRPEVLTAPSLYALSLRVLEYLPRVTSSSRQEREFPDALRLLIADGGRVGGELVENRMVLTHPTDLLVINRRFLRRAPSRVTVHGEIPPDVTIVPPVHIEAGAWIGGGCQIGPEVFLEKGCRVHKEAVVRRAVVLRNASVEANRLVEDTLIT